MELTVDSIKQRIEDMKCRQDKLSEEQKELSYQLIVDKLIVRILEDTVSVIDKSTGHVLSISEL